MEMLIGLYIFLLVELVIVSLADLKTKKIRNYWSLLNILVFIVLAIFYPKTYPFEFDTFFYSLCFLGVGFGLFWIKIMGGGDSKFLTTFYLLVPPTDQPLMLECLLYSTLLVGGAFLIYNTIKKIKLFTAMIKYKNLIHIKAIYGSKFCFAPVILLSHLVFGYLNVR